MKNTKNDTKKNTKKNTKTIAPYNKDDILTVRIEDMGQSGEGIGHTKDGYTLFVKDAVIGDTVKVKIMKASPSYAYAKLLRVESASEYRVEPRCAIAEKCGGCQIQALSYERQLQFKQDKVRNDLVRIGGFDAEYIDRIMSPIVGMENPFRYRNKEQVPVGTGRNGEPVVGFYAGRTHDIVPMTDCKIGAEENRKILEAILSYMKAAGVKAYDETTGQGLLRHVLIRNGIYSRETMVCVVVNGNRLPGEDRLIETLRNIPDVTSITLNVNKTRGNVILGKEIRTIWGKDCIEDDLHVLEVRKTESGADNLNEVLTENSENSMESKAKNFSVRGPHLSFAKTDQHITFRISPLSFYQVNPEQTEKLYSIALDYADLTGKEYVLDLYCGIGTISLFMAKKAREVYGIEIVPEAIRDAKINAERNGITNAVFEAGPAEELLPAFVQRRKAEGQEDPVDVIVVDPPRKGLDDVTINTMLGLSPKRIVYVSCDPATLARDLKKLCAEDYKLEKITPVDQFGHTVHVETVVLLRKGNQIKISTL